MVPRATQLPGHEDVGSSGGREEQEKQRGGEGKDRTPGPATLSRHMWAVRQELEAQQQGQGPFLCDGHVQVAVHCTWSRLYRLAFRRCRRPTDDAKILPNGG
ncbi:hypothetical protein P7K49_026035, partial [Saguinus oedipus]